VVEVSLGGVELTLRGVKAVLRGGKLVKVTRSSTTMIHKILMIRLSLLTEYVKFLTETGT